jgi:hypothetical protein
MDLLIVSIILFVKSNEDILQGVNKLDHLLKVSEFQKYKIEMAPLIDEDTPYVHIDTHNSRKESIDLNLQYEKLKTLEDEQEQNTGLQQSSLYSE